MKVRSKIEFQNVFVNVWIILREVYKNSRYSAKYKDLLTGDWQCKSVEWKSTKTLLCSYQYWVNFTFSLSLNLLSLLLSPAFAFSCILHTEVCSLFEISQEGLFHCHIGQSRNWEMEEIVIRRVWKIFLLQYCSYEIYIFF